MEDLPPFTGMLVQLDDYYRFGLTVDGVPGKRTADGTVVEHPIYGVYALDDYVRQLKREGAGEEVRAGLVTLADRIVARMTPVGDGLAYIYQAGALVNARGDHTHYSALTQAYYARVLSEAAQLAGAPHLTEAAEACYRSLHLPVDRGGVLRDTAEGPVLSEVPQQPDSYILNGWTSCLLATDAYARTARDDHAQDFVRQSAAALVAVLPRYDAPEHANSRYCLTGFAYLRMTFPAVPGTLQDLRLSYGDEAVPVGLQSRSRWEPWVFDKDVTRNGRGGVVPNGRSVRLNVVTSAAPSGTPVLSAVVDEPVHSTRVGVEMYVGRYDPLSTGPVDPRWMDLPEGRVDDNGRVCVQIPEDVCRDLALPTTFTKRIDGHHTNVYHPVHVSGLYRICGEIRPDPALFTTAERWARYVTRWPEFDRYDGLRVRMHGGTDHVTTYDRWEPPRAYRAAAAAAVGVEAPPWETAS